MVRLKSDYKIKNDLERLLKEKEMTADELANKIGITSATISRFKNSKTNLSMESVIDITKVLNITIGELFGEIPVNYKDIANIRYINNINLFSSCAELENKNHYKNYGFSIELLKIFEIVKNIDNLIIAKTGNNSMYPTISTTDFMIIDLSQKELDRDGLYLIDEQNILEVRRILIDEENEKVKVIVDNDKHMGSLGKNNNKTEINKLICGKVLKIIKRDSY